MRYVMGYGAALCVLIVIVCQSVIIPTFFVPFFRWQYRMATGRAGLNTAQVLGISEDDLMHVTRELLDYMRGRRDTLHGVTAEVQGRNAWASRAYGENFFSPTEIRHMYDVRVLYNRLYAVRNIAFFLGIALVLGMTLMREKTLYWLARCCREVLVGFVGLVAILAVVIAIDFNRSWDIFHYIFFRGDAANYWRLIPFEDLMINMFPLRFFVHISIFIGGLIVVFSGAIVALSSVYLHRMKQDMGFRRP